MNPEIEKKIEQILFVFAYKLKNEIQNNITKQGAIDTGHLRASYVVEKHGKSIVVGSRLEYAPHVEFGTSQHFPPIEPIKAWVHRKIRGAMLASPEKEERAAGRKMNEDDVARAIAWKIFHYGTPAQPHFRPALDQSDRLLKEAVDEVK